MRLKGGILMISISIKIITLVCILISIGTIDKKKSIMKRIFKSINESYHELINQQGLIMRNLIIICGILLFVLLCIISFVKYCFADGRDISFKNIVASVVILIITSLIMYLGCGSLLAIFSKTLSLIENVKDHKMGIRMMSSFVLLTFLSYFSFIVENELRKNLVYFFAGLVTCYISNMQIMLKIVRNPFCIVEDKSKQRSENRVLIIYSSILIVIMIIVNLYLLVLWTYFSYDNAYTCCSSDGGITKWQLLYYTVITFTTVGYGDISPTILESQAVAILISITSVMCLIIFVSSVLSVKDDIFGENTKIIKMEPKREIEKEMSNLS